MTLASDVDAAEFRVSLSLLEGCTFFKRLLQEENFLESSTGIIYVPQSTGSRIQKLVQYLEFKRDFSLNPGLEFKMTAQESADLLALADFLAL